ncbi:MAG TPA: hypothetical protein VMX97_13180 [Hyphomicrobiaceae bacterium]|nr:hypothetical protein [Hyphomicrobiaceae bacterium]
MYFAIKGGAPPPWQLIRAQVCERMGWTFDDYDRLDMQDLADLLAVWDGMSIASQKRGARE